MNYEQSIHAARRIEHFAEILSECGNVSEAARRMGIPRNRADKYLRRIRARLGPQAV